MKERRILEQPGGTEGLHLRRTWNHRNLVHTLSEAFESWGYLPVRTPVLDYYDPYAPLLTDSHTSAMYRLIDRDGELLAVRSDATLFLAKQVARMLRGEDLPVRVYYTETILRPEDRENISRNEFFQVGGEIIGNTGSDGDLEIATLLLRLLDSVLPGESVLHVGSRSLVDVLTHGFGPAHAAAFRHALELHDQQECRTLLGDTWAGALGPAGLDAVLEFLLHIGTAEEMRSAFQPLSQKAPDLPEGFSDAVEALIETGRVLESVFDTERIRIDPSETGSQSYHTGVAFRAYAPGAEAAVASGGRYDSLYGHFGLDTQAVGFSIMLRRIERLSGSAPLPETTAIARDGRDFVERLREADRARSRGERVRLE